MCALDNRDILPSGMREYVSNYGFTFSKKACDYAVSLMKRDGRKIEPWKKEEVEELLSRYGITLEHNEGYNATYVANMAKADYYKKSIPDEQHLAMFVKDYIDDEDGNEELPFRRWLASMVSLGKPVYWEDII